MARKKHARKKRNSSLKSTGWLTLTPYSKRKYWRLTRKCFFENQIHDAGDDHYIICERLIDVDGVIIDMLEPSRRNMDSGGGSPRRSHTVMHSERIMKRSESIRTGTWYNWERPREGLHYLKGFLTKIMELLWKAGYQYSRRHIQHPFAMSDAMLKEIESMR